MQKLDKILKPKYSYNLVRVGNKHDGGYLIGSSTLSKSNCLVSLGIRLEFTFEKNFYETYKKKIFTFDRNYFKHYFKEDFLISLNELRNFNLKKIFGIVKNFIKIKKYEKKLNFSKKLITYNSISEIINSLPIKENILLKVDIDGAEYRTLDCILKNQSKIIGLIIEFHDIDLHFEKIVHFINNFNLKISHIHANNFGIADKRGNPTVIEMTFEKDPEIIGDNVEIPNKIDNKNNPLKKDFTDYFDK